jgi:hypothetical protein
LATRRGDDSYRSPHVSAIKWLPPHFMASLVDNLYIDRPERQERIFDTLLKALNNLLN